MYNKLIETEDEEMNQIKVNFIKKILSKLQKTVDYAPKDNTFKIEENKKIIDMVKLILEFHELNKKEDGLKTLSPNQMFGILPISLAQLTAGHNPEKLKNEIRQILHFLYRSKKLTKQNYKSLIDII